MSIFYSMEWKFRAKYRKEHQKWKEKEEMRVVRNAEQTSVRRCAYILTRCTTAAENNTVKDRYNYFGNMRNFELDFKVPLYFYIKIVSFMLRGSVVYYTLDKLLIHYVFLCGA